MISFLFDLLDRVLQFAWNIFHAVFTVCFRILSAAASVLFYPLSFLTRWESGISWWTLFRIGWAALVFLLLILAGWVLLAYRQKRM